MKLNTTKWKNLFIPISKEVNLRSSTVSINERKAAVLVPLIVSNNQFESPSLLFTKRSMTVGSHKGHVSFPGGHLLQDESYEDAALRETYEEIGLDPSFVRIVGKMQTVPALTGTPVTPILGIIETSSCKDLIQELSTTLDSVEVDAIFSKSLNDLIHVRREKIVEHKGKSYLMPLYGDDDDPFLVWGLTAWMVQAFLEFTKNELR